MQSDKMFQTNHSVEFAKHLSNRFFRSDVIARSKNVRGIETNGDSFRLANLRHDGGKMFEAVSKACSLAGSCLKRDFCFYLRYFAKNKVNRLNHFHQPRFFSGAQMRAGMQY